MNDKLSFNFSLNDDMSQGLKNITEALSNINDYLEDVDKSIDSVDGQNFNNLKKNISQACGSIEEIGQSFDQASKSATDLNNTGLSNIQKTADRVSQSISGIESEAKNAESSLKKTSNVSFSGLKGDIDSVGNNLSDLKKEAKEAKGSLDDIGDTNLSDTLGNLTSAIDLSNFLNLTEMAEGLVDTIKEIGQSSLESAESVNNAVNTIALGLGTTEDQTNALYDVARNVFTSGYGESIGEVTGQLTYMKQVLGDISNEDLQALLPAFISLDEQGMDFNETLRGVKNLMSGFGIDAQTATGYMVEGFQRGMNQSDELGDNIAEYSARWGEAGISAGTYFSLLDTGLNNSSYNLDKVGDFLNEFLTSLTDGRMESAMGSLSENTRQVFQAYQDNTASAQDVLNAVLTDFQGITNETDKAAIASELWSSLGEDNALGMIESLNGVQDSFGDVTGEAQTFADTNTNAVTTLQNRWQQWKDDTLAPIGNFLAQMALNVMDWFGQTAKNISDTISNVSNRWNEIIAGFQTFEATLKSKLEGLPGWFQEVGTNIIDGLKGGLETAWTSVTTWFSDNFGWIIDDVKTMLGIASPSTIFADIGGNVIQGFLDGAKNIWESVTSWIGGAIGGFIDKVKQGFSSLFGGGDQSAPGSDIDYSETIARVQGQLDQLKAIVQEAFDQINAQASSIAQMSQSVIQAFIDMVSVSINSVVNLETTTVSTVTTMVGNLIGLSNELRAELINIWTSVQTTTVTIIKNMAAQVVAAIRSMCSSILSEVRKMPAQMRQVGTSMMSSFRSGIESQRAAVSDTAGSIVQQLKTTFEQGLGIHSPSDYMIWVGQMMLAGLLEGMSGDQVQRFIDSMIGDMQNSFSNGKFNAGELVNFLSDDATLNLIGRISGMDFGDMNPETIAYPLIGTMGTQTSWFGPRESPGGIGSTNHGGVDLAAPTGTPIAAALAGNVTTAGWYGGYGQAVVIDSGNGIDITYGHMSSVGAQVGQTVQKGQQIGLVGSTGNSTGPHLHFEMHQNGSRIDPQPYIEGASISAGNTLASSIQNAYNLKHGIASAMSLGNVNYDVSAGAAQWTPQVLQALAMLGQPASLLQGVLYAIDSESGGNPNAINDWDSNAAMGDPSRGLLQTIGGTFNAYRNPNLSANIYDPLANIYAGLNYMIQRYGSVANVVNPRLGHWYGYEVGTRYVPEDMFAMIHKGEAIIPAGQNPYTNSGGDYLGDMLQANLNAEDYTTPVSTGGSSNVQITLNVTQNITDSTNARAKADEVINILYDELERRHYSTGGGVILGY